MKKRLMAQAAAAEAEAAAASAGGVGGKFDPSKDALWRIDCDLRAVKNLAEDLDLKFRVAPPKTEDTGSTKPGRFKWNTSLDTAFVFDFKTASPREDIADIDWANDIKGVERSDAGAEGVFFVETNKGAVVLKGSRSMAAEVYSSMLGLKLGIFCPAWRIIATASPEGQSMIKHLSDADPSGRVYLNLKSQTHVLMKAFVPGANFGEIGEKRAVEIFGLPGMPSTNGEARLRELGRILALDVLCNNGDRFPLIWDNRGNAGNVMYGKGVGQTINIDSQCMPIDGRAHPDQLKAYMGKCAQLVKDTVEAAAGNAEAPQFARVRSKIKEYCGLDIGEKGTSHLQAGFLEITNNKESFGLTRELLDSWRTALEQFDPPLVGLQCADADFVLGVWATF